IIRGQGTKRVNALDGPRGRLVKRWDTARLLHLNVRGVTVAHHVKGDVHALRRRDAGVHFVFQPVLGNLLLHHAHIPGVARAEIAASTGKAEAALGPVGVEVAIRPADRAALSEGNLVIGFDHRFRLGLLVSRAGLWYGLDLSGLVRDGNRVRFFLHRLGLRLREPFRIVGQNVFGFYRIGRQRDVAHQAYAHGVAAAARAPAFATAAGRDHGI